MDAIALIVIVMIASAGFITGAILRYANRKINADSPTPPPSHLVTDASGEDLHREQNLPG